MTHDQEPKRLLRRKTGDGPQQWLQAFEPVIHGHEQSHRFLTANSPSVPPFLTELRPVGISKSPGIDGAMYNPKSIRTDAVILLKMPGDHVTVDDNQRAIFAQILLFFQLGKGPMRQIQLLHDAGGNTNPAKAMLADIVIGRRRMQSSLRIENVLSPGFVETNRDQMAVVAKRGLAGRTESPRAQKARSDRAFNRVHVHFLR